LLLVFGLRHGQRVDVVAAAGEQPDHAREHARLVVDDHRQRVGFDLFRDRRGGIVGGTAHNRFLIFGVIARLDRAIQ
jgi:hypothetical protein